MNRVSKHQLIPACIYGADGSTAEIYLHPDMTIQDVTYVAMLYGGVPEDETVKVSVAAMPFGQVVRVVGESGTTDVHLSFLEETQ